MRLFSLQPAWVLLFLATAAHGQPFQRTTLHTGAPQQSAIATGDFNKDGRSDLAIASGQFIEIRFANAQGEFPTRDILVFDVRMPIYDMRAVDLDLDGSLEVVAAGGNPDSGAVFVLKRGSSPGVYSPAAGSPHVTAATVHRLAIADFNLDGKLDIAAQSGIPAIHILLQSQNGDFAFAPGAPRVFTGYPGGIAAGDFDRNGKPDLVYADMAAFHVLLGNGDGSFAAPPDGGSYLHSPRPDMNTFGVAAADFDKDGKLDFAGGTSFDVYWGNGSGGFQTGNGSGSVTVGEVVDAVDMTGDGKLDFWGVTAQGFARILVGDGMRRFDTIGGGLISLPGLPTGAATGDFNGDGRRDFVVLSATEEDVWIYRNLNSSPSPQTIDFATIPPLTLGTPSAQLQATASSGLPVEFRVISGPATVQGNVLMITGIGSIVVEAFQPGSASFNPASVRQTLVVSSAIAVTEVIHGASLSSGFLAPSSFAAIKGLRFPAQPVVRFVDSTGISATGIVTFASATQINVVLPPFVGIGAATLTVEGPDGPSNGFPVSIAPVSPGIFMADPAQSFPAAHVIDPLGPPGQLRNAASCGGTPLVCVLDPINIPANAPAFLVLYGTGIRGFTSSAAVTARADTTPLTVSYVGPVGSGLFPGLDQINLMLPPSLAGRGITTIWITVQGFPANPVRVNIR